MTEPTEAITQSASDSVRYVYNWALEKKKKAYAETKKGISYKEMRPDALRDSVFDVAFEKGVDIAIISESTGLSEQEIKKLKTS